MDENKLSEIKARCEKATPGPWTSTINWSNDRTRRIISEPDEDVVIQSSRYGHDEIEINEADKWFILCAREDVPALVAEVERLQRKCEIAQMTLEKISDQNRYKHGIAIIKLDSITPPYSDFVWNYAYHALKEIDSA